MNVPFEWKCTTVELYSEREQLKDMMNKHAWLPLTLTFDPVSCLENKQLPCACWQPAVQCSHSSLSPDTATVPISCLSGNPSASIRSGAFNNWVISVLKSATIWADNRKASHIPPHSVRSVKVVLISLPFVYFGGGGIWIKLNLR